MTDDFVKRLRDFEQWMRDPEDQKFTLSSDLFDEAADRIEELETYLAEAQRCLDVKDYEGAIIMCRAALGEKTDG
jgi:hypothetical protein